VLSAGKLYADPLSKWPRLMDLVQGSLSGSLYSLFRADLMRLYAVSAAAKMKFHLLAVPRDVRVRPRSMEINPGEMQLLFDVGYQMSAGGIDWRTIPAGVLPGEEDAPRAGLDFITK
jgi:hypothetical protein